MAIQSNTCLSNIFSKVYVLLQYVTEYLVLRCVDIAMNWPEFNLVYLCLSFNAIMYVN